jgi:hypothetical protein
MRPSEAEIKDVIQTMITSIKRLRKKASAHRSGYQKSFLYKRSLRSVIKFCNKALEAEGPELRELCLYILGNAIYWDGPETKEKLRRFSFHGAASYRKAIFKQEIADLMKDEEAQVDSRMM